MFAFKFPDIGEGITEGTLIKWLVEEGEQVKEGQDLAEVETDKMTTNIPSASAGTVHKLHVEEYGELTVGEVFITIDDGSGEKAPVPQEEEEEEAAGVVGELISGKEELPPSEEGSAKVEKAPKRKKALATPVARKLAKDLGVDINEIEGSGPGGRVMKEDIHAFADKSEEPAPAKEEKEAQPIDRSTAEHREPLTRIRMTIARKMSESKDGLVHTTTMEEIDVSRLVAFREKMKEIAGDEVKLTYLPFVIKAITLALKEFPIMNSSYDEEAKEIVYKNYYNIGIATDTDRGLVVPVLFDVDHRSILELAKDIEALAQKANDGSLTLEDMRGGTFTITNYGAIGGSFGTPIINYPEAAILGIGRIQEKPVVRDGKIVIGHLLPLSLSFDHRMIDGAVGVRFTRFLAEALGSPELLLLRS